MRDLGKSFWLEKWNNLDTPWDLGAPHPSLGELFSSLAPFLPKGRKPRFFEPGCGGGHDSFYLWQAGCDVTGLDLSEAACQHAQRRFADAVVKGGLRFVSGDVFSTETRQLLSDTDVVYDRALLCALPEKLRTDLLEKLLLELKPGALYATIVAAKISPADRSGPPFAVSEDELLSLIGSSLI